MNWRALLTNRWVLLAGAGAAGLGLVAFLRRGKGTAGGTGVEGEDAGYQPGGVGYFDSAATDFAHQLGQNSAGWQNQFNEFTRRVEDMLADLPDEGPPVVGFPTDPHGRSRDVEISPDVPPSRQAPRTPRDLPVTLGG